MYLWDFNWPFANIWHKETISLLIEAFSLDLPTKWTTSTRDVLLKTRDTSTWCLKPHTLPAVTNHEKAGLFLIGWEISDPLLICCMSSIFLLATSGGSSCNKEAKDIAHMYGMKWQLENTTVHAMNSVHIQITIYYTIYSALNDLRPG